MDGKQSPPIVTMVHGFWGQNIGNAFFNLGGRYLVEQVFGSENVRLIQDQPAYRTFNRKSRGTDDRDAGLLQSLQSDIVVLQGPMLTSSFGAIWGETFRRFAERGTRVWLIGAGFFRFTDEEFESAISVLRESPVELISTRDRRTADVLAAAELDVRLFDGVDSAFFLPDAVTPAALDLPPFAALNFDRHPEPTFDELGSDDAVPSGATTVGDAHFRLHQPSVQDALSRAGKAQAYLGSLVDRRSRPAQLGGLLVIRPEHRYIPFVRWKIYGGPGGFATDEPYTYLAVYSAADVVLSDRVHACVAALAYGGRAQLFSPTPRGSLLDRVGAHSIRQRVVELDMDALAGDKRAELNFLEQSARELGYL